MHANPDLDASRVLVFTSSSVKPSIQAFKNAVDRAYAEVQNHPEEEIKQC
jgi:hypothetical protein